MSWVSELEFNVPFQHKHGYIRDENVVGKVMESIIRDHVMKHFLKNDVFSNRQYGFLKGRSTVLQLLRIIDEWTLNLDLGGQIDCIYMDFQKAFDKVPH